MSEPEERESQEERGSQEEVGSMLINDVLVTDFEALRKQAEKAEKVQKEAAKLGLLKPVTFEQFNE
jgi:hypothetical protein